MQFMFPRECKTFSGEVSVTFSGELVSFQGGIKYLPLHTLVLRSGHVHCMHINWVKLRQKSETSASRRSAMCFIWLEARTSCQILSKNSKVSTSLCSAMGFILIQSPVRHVVSLASTSGQIQSKNSKVSTSLCSVMWFILLQSPAGHVAYLRT